MSNTNTLTQTGTLRRIVVATDGTEASAGAVRTGVALARARGARLIGLSIALDNPEYSTLVPNLQEAAERNAREALKSFVDEAGPGVETVTRDATDPAQGIAAAADELNADLIVMGRQHKSALGRLLVGHTTAGVIGAGATPVLVVPRAARLWEKRVLLATDGSSYSQAAAEAAGRLAAQTGLAVSVVSVVTTSHNDARRKEAQRAVTVALEHLRSLGLAADGEVAEGRPDEAIVRAAESAGADLIVLGSRGRTGLTKVLMGSVAERVIGHAACPVLVVKP